MQPLPTRRSASALARGRGRAAFLLLGCAALAELCAQVGANARCVGSTDEAQKDTVRLATGGSLVGTGLLRVARFEILESRDAVASRRLWQGIAGGAFLILFFGAWAYDKSRGD